MIVLDTNVVSELVKPRAHPSAVAWTDAHNVSRVYATAVTEAELLSGLTVMPAGARHASLRRDISTIFAGLLIGRILPFDRRAAAGYAELAAELRRAGRPTNTADLQIAAIARARRARAIATRNTADVEGCGILLITPWEAPAA